jgi:hypothetical protein
MPSTSFQFSLRFRKSRQPPELAKIQSKFPTVKVQPVQQEATKQEENLECTEPEVCVCGRAPGSIHWMQERSSDPS